MPRDLINAEREMFEALIEACSIESVLKAMSLICGQKAAQSALHWQDTITAKRWAKLAMAIDGIVPKAEEL